MLFPFLQTDPSGGRDLSLAVQYRLLLDERREGLAAESQTRMPLLNICMYRIIEKIHIMLLFVMENRLKN